MSRHSDIPKPTHPTARHQPLPWEKPKPVEEEANVKDRLRAIMQHPNYLQADRDVEFLHTGRMRGLRLQLDYEKVEQTLCSHGVERTIVVFGSTRLREPEAARHAVEDARRRLATHPDDVQRQKALAIAERRMDLSRYYTIGRDLGRLIGQAGSGEDGSRVVVMTGGGPGAMEAANRGAFEAGAETVGLNIKLPREQYPNPYLTPGLCLQFHYFALRKLHFMQRAAAIVALPGGFGTLDELFGAITLMQTRKTPPVPVILIGEAYWRATVDVDFLEASGSIDAEDRDLFWYAETAEQTWNGILAWHQANGTPLFPSQRP